MSQGHAYLTLFPHCAISRGSKMKETVNRHDFGDKTSMISLLQVPIEGHLSHDPQPSGKGR